ncbi:MFS family permease [Azospirillum fermentarium]|uniref:MFS transporter n=1 Tax=Azospirillum fermentarium TaxID=1233114 RepID=UPI0022270D2F|nr:MFS transporter [Azospirillum fermentarium]MCW2246148.1 MFS family permease [Azospirillum fermentarium]
MESNSASWRSPAVLVACGCMIAAIGFGVRSTYGLFNTPLSEANGWGRDVFSLALAMQNLLWGAAQPFAGGLTDRFGAARVLAVGGILYGLGVALTPLAHSPLMLHLTSGVLVGLGLACTSFTVVIAAFSRRMGPERRAWAAGIGTAAGSMGQFLFAPLGQAFIAAYGWSTAMMLLGGSAAMIIVLSIGLSDGSGKQDGHATAHLGPSLTVGAALREAFAHRSYVLLVAGFFVCGFHLAFITVHLPPYLRDIGLDPALAGWAIALIGLFNVVGAYSSGMLSTRMPKRYLLALIYAARAAAIALFIAFPASPVTVLAFAAAMGLLWLSTVPPTSGLVSVMFGVRHLGMLFGIAFFSHQIGSFLGVWLAGVMFERTGTYDVVWWLSIALGLASALVHLPIVERPVSRPVAVPAE